MAYSEMDKVEQILQCSVENISQDLTVQMLSALIHIARNPGVSQTEMCDILKGTRPAVHHLLNRMSDAKYRDHWKSKSGEGLIEFKQDAKDSRVVHCFATEKGKVIFNHIATIMNNQPEKAKKN